VIGQYAGPGAGAGKLWLVRGSLLESSWQPLDAANPTLGVSLSYLPGPVETELCPDTGQRRAVGVNVYCSKDRLVVLSAVETSECVYSMQMQSYHACPLECPHNDDTGLCNGRGTCSYSSSLGAAFCECEYPFTGTACESDDAGIAIISSFLHALFLLLTVLTCLGCSYRAYKLRQAQSMLLRHDELEEGRGAFGSIMLRRQVMEAGPTGSREWARDPPVGDRVGHSVESKGGHCDSGSGSDSDGDGQCDNGERRGLLNRTTYGGI